MGGLVFQVYKDEPIAPVEQMQWLFSICFSTIKQTMRLSLNFHLFANQITRGLMNITPNFVRCVMPSTRGRRMMLFEFGSIVGITIFVNLGLLRHFETFTNIRTWIKPHIYWRML